MSGHTTGKARIATETGPCVVAVGEREVCECYQDGEVQTIEDEANARRLAACWNACAGISTVDLEAVGDNAVVFKHQRDTLAALLRQAIALKPMKADTYHAIRAALAHIAPVPREAKRNGGRS